MQAQNLLTALEQQFQPLANPERARQQQQYMKSQLPFFGVTKPVVARIAKQFAKQYAPQDHVEYCAIIMYLFAHAKQREIWYAALDYAMMHKKFIIPESVATYLEIIRFAAWWDIVDVVADHLVGKALLQVPDQKVYLTAWIVDEHMWVRRTALIAQLKYKTVTDHELLANCIACTMHEKEFFIRKAIGWALRSYSYTNPAWVIQFIQENNSTLSHLSKKEGLKALERQHNKI